MKNTISVLILIFVAELTYAAPRVVISCFRGPWQEVIWDRPNPIFIDTLMANGYSITTATAIAERICRDPNLVNQNELSIQETIRLMKLIPKDGN